MFSHAFANFIVCLVCSCILLHDLEIQWLLIMDCFYYLIFLLHRTATEVFCLHLKKALHRGYNIENDALF